MNGEELAALRLGPVNGPEAQRRELQKDCLLQIQPVGESTSDRYVRLLRKGCTSEMQAQL